MKGVRAALPRLTGGRFAVRAVLALAVVLAPSLSAIGQAADAGRQIQVTARPIARFGSDIAGGRTGRLEFLGGLEISSPDRAFGGISALRVLADGTRVAAVLDRGRWLTGRLVRDQAGRLTGFRDVRIARMWRADANRRLDPEGLAIAGGNAFVSFERSHRIERHALAGLLEAGAPRGVVRHPIPPRELRYNRGLETLAAAPPASRLAGALVTVSERSLNRNGDIFAAIVGGPNAEVFFVRRHPPYDVTDGDFLDSGDLLLLERSFSLFGGFGMRIRRIPAAALLPGRTVDGPVMLEAGPGDNIDNMESLDVFEIRGGETRIILASDDNHRFFQRSLILEFRLADSAAVKSGAPAGSRR